MPHTILVVEDEGEVAEVLTIALEKAGYRVLKSRDVIAAAALIDSEKPSLIILDLMLPRISGTDLLKELQQDPEKSKIPVVVLSGILDNPGLRSRLEGVPNLAKVLKKPIRPSQLVAEIGKVLNPPDEKES